MIFYPAGASVPHGFQTQHLLLRPLLAADNALDYAAVMASREYLQAGTSGLWPQDDFTPAENLQDLQEHEADHAARTSFTFTVMNPEGSECLGCVYLNSLDELLEKYAALTPAPHSFPPGCGYVDFWMRPACQAAGLDRHLLDQLLDWFDREWQFPRVVFTANQLEQHQRGLYEQAGLQPLLTLSSQNRITIFGR